MSALVIEIAVPKGALRTANQRHHWAEQARRTKVLRLLASRAWRAAGSPHMTRCRAVVTVAYPDRRRRDADNLRPTIKALIDGLVADGRGLLPDDSDAHINSPELIADRAHLAPPQTWLFTITLTETES